MMSEPQSAVVAGSKGFVDAMGAHLKMRFGAAPQVARDAQEALAACGDKGGLLVLEYAGVSWLDAVKGLRGLSGGGGVLSIVAAIAPAQSADAEPLRRAGVDEVVSWQGRVDPVVWAVDRVMGRSRGRQNSDTRPNPAPVRGDVSGNGSEPGESPVAPASCAAVLTPGAPLSAANQAASEIAAVLWPGAVPSAAAAEALLLSVVAGRAAGEAGPVAAAERVLAAVSELERTAFSGAEVPIDCAFLRSIVALRLRLDLALSSAPAAGCAVDQVVAEQLLADVDGILAQLKALGPSAPPGVMPALDPTRLAIVDGGVQLAGALSQLVPVGEGQPATAVVLAKEPATRVLSNEMEAPREGLGSSSKVLWVALALVFTAVAGHHGWRLATRPAPTPPATMPGAPINTYSMKMGATHMLKTLAGKQVDPAELERFKIQEQATGNMVRDLGSGTWAIEPDPAGGGTKP